MDIDDIRNFFFDLDRTLWNWNSLILGAEDLIHTLRDEGRNVYFHTDNTLLSSEAYARKLTDMGIPASREDILTSGEVAAEYLEKENVTEAYIIGEDDLIQQLEERDIDFSGEADTVVAGFDRQFSYSKLKRAMNVLEDGRLLLCSTEDVFRTSKTVQPHQGPVNRALETFRKGKLVCKPGEEYQKAFKQHFSFFPGSSMMVGDRFADIETGNRLGMTTAAVMSGEINRDKLEKAEDIRKPDYGVSSLNRLRRKVL